jgi:PIN domain nuclease of toxin-antitoxin system
MYERHIPRHGRHRRTRARCMGSDVVILLDTHSFFWLIGDDKSLGKAARRAIQEASVQNALYLSPISMWEIALKASRGRLQLDRPVRPWMRYALQLTRIQLSPITAEVACSCAELPPEFHGDPADRIIAATARTEGLRLVTHDKKLLDLARQGFFQAIAT